MAFDENLGARIRKALARKKGVEEKKMFGGLGFLLNGNMCVGVWKTSMIVRVDPDDGEAALLEHHVGEFNSVADEGAVKAWVQRAVKFVSRLPAK
jgi:TfoX/Sxy family transcriptional regulator of competence genes